MKYLEYNSSSNNCYSIIDNNNITISMIKIQFKACFYTVSPILIRSNAVDKLYLEQQHYYDPNDIANDPYK